MTRTILLMILLVLAVTPLYAEQVVVTFEELPLSGSDHYDGCDGPDFSSLEAEFRTGQFLFQGDCFWSGWGYSNAIDTATAGAGNQYSAYAGEGSEGSSQFGIAFSGPDGGGGGVTPLVMLPERAEPVSLQVANSTYAALSMLQGDSFAKPFGGISGNDPDWFLLTILGQDSSGTTLGEVEHYLADYRFADPANDFVQDDWQEVDLAPLRDLGVTQLEFRLTSSDVGDFGMNTPAYFVMDNLTLEVPGKDFAAADFNEDDSVDLLDLSLWQTNYGSMTVPPAAPPVGDANDDSVISGSDLLIWQQQYAPFDASLANSSAVPEPSSILFAGISFCFFLHLKTYREDS